MNTFYGSILSAVVGVAVSTAPMSADGNGAVKLLPKTG